MARKKHGKRFQLLLYRRLIGRYRWPAFLLAGLMLGLWYASSLGLLSWPPPAAAGALLAGGMLSSVLWIFALIGPALAYVQARQDHLRLQTPLMRLEVDYDLIHSSRPVDLRKVYPGKILRRYRALLEPFMGLTCLAIELRQMPVSRWRMRIFFHRLHFEQDRSGLVLITRDWAALSQQIATRASTWHSAQAGQGQAAPSDAAKVLRQESDDW